MQAEEETSFKVSVNICCGSFFTVLPTSDALSNLTVNRNFPLWGGRFKAVDGDGSPVFKMRIKCFPGIPWFRFKMLLHGGGGMDHDDRLATIKQKSLNNLYVYLHSKPYPKKSDPVSAKGIEAAYRIKSGGKGSCNVTVFRLSGDGNQEECCTVKGCGFTVTLSVKPGTDRVLMIAFILACYARHQ